ncbi:unnamed protein product [Staurois parvus]|uniref:Uncharacterized protein n=1 Tax=Staurois parvus TaxID=386267 RepID=A0ABN9E6G5_9NEOB|nr:unnamed protein product [Staurois parvus]
MGPPTDPGSSGNSYTTNCDAHFSAFNTSVSGQGRTDNSWGPWAIGHHGAPFSLPKLKKAYEKDNKGISWGPLLTPGPRAVPEFPNGQ